MPGMMVTNPEPRLQRQEVEGLAQVSKNARFAWDCYRRFVAMYGDVVLELKPLDRSKRDPFEVLAAPAAPRAAPGS
jgi:pyruvate,orthophosphate dikinase